MYEDIDFSNIFNDSNSTQEEGGDLSNHQSESAQRPQSLTDGTYEYFVKTVSDGRK
ncbi:MAG: hypothetical protein KatS3mg083_041 [Candidatus Dojkabacteria bacterium]|nr:MAG: hypothetical protein KatS3mg083_041 [Candidatus Dojkabacteria bacterium]